MYKKLLILLNILILVIISLLIAFKLSSNKYINSVLSNVNSSNKIDTKVHGYINRESIIKWKLISMTDVLTVESGENAVLPKTSQEVENTEVYKISIPHIGDNIQTVEGDFRQETVDNYDVIHVKEWSDYMNCDLFYGHNTNTLGDIYKLNYGEIITVTDNEGNEAHYRVVLSRYGVLHESHEERGELMINGVHYNRGFITDANNENDIIFAYSDDGYDNNNLILLTCYTKYSEDGRWVVKTVRVDDEYELQKKLNKEREQFKQVYLEKNLYSRPNTITYKKSNYNYTKASLNFQLLYNNDTKKLIKLDKVLGKKIYGLEDVVVPEEGEQIVISNPSGGFKTFNVMSVVKGKRYQGKLDEKTGFFKTYLIDDNNRVLFSFNNDIPADSSRIILDIVNEDGEYICKLQ